MRPDHDATAQAEADIIHFTNDLTTVPLIRVITAMADADGVWCR